MSLVCERRLLRRDARIVQDDSPFRTGRHADSRDSWAQLRPRTLGEGYPLPRTHNPPRGGLPAEIG